jgi:hypothetical protein
MTLSKDQQMIEKLSPPGLDAWTREALAYAIQFPGRSLTEVVDNTGDLVGALHKMMEDPCYDWMADHPQKDSLP